MRRPERRWPGLVLPLLLALGLMASGLWSLGQVSLGYRPLDLAYSDTPRSFRAWLGETWRSEGGAERAAEAMAARLKATPIASRRRLVAAMMENSFWSGLAAGERDRRALLEASREAVLRAALAAPMAGELWLAAARLHMLLDGFDSQAAAYLEASYLFAPRDGQVAYARLALLVDVLPVLSGRLAEAAAADLALIEATYPRLHRAAAARLEAGEPVEGGREPL